MPQAPLVRPATIHVCRARITRLAATGAPLTGATSGYVTQHIQSVERAIRNDDGELKEMLDGCDNVDVELQLPDKFRGFDFTVEFPRDDPRLLEIMTGVSLLMDTSTAPVPRGYNHPTSGAVDPPKVAFEIWSHAREGGAPAPSPFSLFRRIYPMTTWRIDDQTYDGDFQTVTLVGKSSPNAGWGVGLGDQGGSIDENGATLFVDTMPADSAGAYVAVP